MKSFKSALGLMGLAHSLGQICFPSGQQYFPRRKQKSRVAGLVFANLESVIGSRLKAARKRRGLSQRDLGSRLGIVHSAISKWESKGSVPSEHLPSLARELSVTVHHLLGLPEHHGTKEEPQEGPALEALAVIQGVIDEGREVVRLRQRLAELEEEVRLLRLADGDPPP